jgi:L-2-hydroxyglutarate oxidase LhgO
MESIEPVVVGAGIIGPAHFGIRSRVAHPGDATTDFIVQRLEAGRLINLGIESPGLTAPLALAEFAVSLARDHVGEPRRPSARAMAAVR